MIAIFILTGLVVPGIMMTRAHDLAGKNPLLSYQPSNDTLRIAEPSLEITPASGRVSFSFEHFIKHDHYFELNLVLDGERRKFLSPLSPDPFHPLARQIREMGFRVAEQTVKL